jgi:hypothetical protein
MKCLFSFTLLLSFLVLGVCGSSGDDAMLTPDRLDESSSLRFKTRSVAPTSVRFIVCVCVCVLEICITIYIVVKQSTPTPTPTRIAPPVSNHPTVGFALSLSLSLCRNAGTHTYTSPHKISAAKRCRDGGYPGTGNNRHNCQSLCQQNEPGCFILNFHHCAAIARKCQTKCTGKFLNACAEYPVVKQVLAHNCGQYCI